MSSGQWTEPVFVEDPYLRVHGLAPGLNYGKDYLELPCLFFFLK